MSNLLSKLRKKATLPTFEQFCLQINKDEMLFFPSKDKMLDYLCDYRKRIPIYRVSMFKVQFFNL